MSAAGYPSIRRTVRFDDIKRSGWAAAKRVVWGAPTTPGVRIRRIVFAKSIAGPALRYEPVTTVTV
ncbi:hypothetical protein O6V14_07535 [Sphingomonas faeni]|uniref:hypothetical protein n=1 Tax=Sphingomonas TaxID=13687 RepID=UPI002FDF4A7E